mmetsp:Transcript_10048/g.31476  ORF Transcript_10048/g.31476 Transcript_10048/m.31476 type:complete len:278 (-) Transcript_10048:116-949(-)
MRRAGSDRAAHLAHVQAHGPRAAPHALGRVAPLNALHRLPSLLPCRSAQLVVALAPQKAPRVTLDNARCSALGGIYEFLNRDEPHQRTAPPRLARLERRSSRLHLRGHSCFCGSLLGRLGRLHRRDVIRSHAAKGKRGNRLRRDLVRHLRSSPRAAGLGVLHRCVPDALASQRLGRNARPAHPRLDRIEVGPLQRRRRARHRGRQAGRGAPGAEEATERHAPPATAQPNARRQRSRLTLASARLRGGETEAARVGNGRGVRAKGSARPPPPAVRAWA